jgi:phosphopantothenoylcysteine decarboxylase/phosphopantothenate--cysteine ligase
MLNDKTIVLGVSGSIAAYKAAYLASRLTQEGARVDVIMTEAATRLVTPLTFRSLTDRPVVTSMWQASEHGMGHITLADSAQVVVVAPATANVIARLAAGIADDMLTATVLATRAPVIIAPAMHANMFTNPVTRDNLARLRGRGFNIVGPEHGRLASGDSGKGRLVEIEQIIDAIKEALKRSADLSGKRIVVTAGGTQEPIDPARHIGNRSSGRMGFALAEAARDRGAEVTLITAPTQLPEPDNIEIIRVRTASEMKEAVTKAVKKAGALIMAAAVADYRPKSPAQSKVKKQSHELTLELVRTPDILSEVKGGFIRVGFAAESEDVVANARKKLTQKGLDLIVANDITEPESGFGADTNKVTIIDKQGNLESLPLMSKREVAERILDRVAGMGGNPP